jgi:hypothetical protein
LKGGDFLWANRIGKKKDYYLKKATKHLSQQKGEKNETIDGGMDGSSVYYGSDYGWM